MTTTRYFWETNLYDLRTGDLLCSVQTESFDPLSVEAMAHEYGKLIVADMVNNDILKKPASTTGIATERRP